MTYGVIGGAIGYIGGVGALETGGSLDPLADLDWYAAFWAENPNQEFTPDGAVSQWDDGSGNSRHLTQPVVDRRPTFKASIPTLNNRPAILFDGAGDILTYVPGASLPHPWSMVVIARQSVLSGERCILSYGTNTGQRGIWTNSNTAFGFSVASAAGLVGPAPDTNAHLFYGVANNTASQFGVDDDVVTGTVNTAGVLTGIAAGGRRDLAAFMSGEIAFAAVYPGDVTTASRWGAFVAWAAEHYGVAGGLGPFVEVNWAMTGVL